jgi:ABC-type Fe3+ transport system substrate-binding protein
MRALILATAAAVATIGLPAEVLAQAPTGKITIITSFSKDVTAPVQKAFEAAHPGTKLEIQNRNTVAGVRQLEETKANNQADLFWASAPDAFEVLKARKLLQAYKPNAKGIPDKIGSYPINDPQGYYFGFAASGYGIMWNERYMKAKNLPAPKEWSDLAKAVYYDHTAISAPSRSGTTHLTIETILQGEGWAKGWATTKAMAGNHQTVTDRSFGVPEGVNSGQFGIGIVIDFFAFSAQAAGFPVKFVYPSVTTIVPANVGIVANAPNAAGAKAFVDFLLSEKGQEVLLEPTIRRLPVNPATYAKAPAGYPNPFKDPSLGAKVKFDATVSEKRNAVVAALYDQLITFQLANLKKATKAIHDAEAALAKKDNPTGRKLIAEARSAIAAMPVTDAQAASPDLAGSFGRGKNKGARQAEIEGQWAAFAKERYAQAQAKAEEALKSAK